MAEVTGLADLEADVRAGNAALREVLDDVVLDGALAVEDEVRARAPRATGELVSHLDTTEGRGRDRATAVVQIDDSGPGGVEHYAVFQEYGTSEMPARPYFRPGVIAVRDKVEGAMEQRLSDVIEHHDR